MNHFHVLISTKLLLVPHVESTSGAWARILAKIFIYAISIFGDVSDAKLNAESKSIFKIYLQLIISELVSGRVWYAGL